MAAAKKKRAKKLGPKPVRTIRTNYYADYEARKLIKSNLSAWPNNAVANALNHLTLGHYFEAVLVEVFDEENGEQHAVISLRIDTSQAVIDYLRPVLEQNDEKLRRAFDNLKKAAKKRRKASGDE